MLKNQPIFTQLVAVLLIILATTTQAKSNKATPIYQVEMIIFETTAIKGWTEEFWAHQIVDISSSGAYPITTTTGVNKIYSYARNKNSVVLITKQSNKYLAGVAKKLTSSRGYRVLSHLAWTQKILPKKSAQTIYFETNPTSKYRSSLKGTIKLYKKKFVHFDIDTNLKHIIPFKIKKSFAKQEGINISNLPSYWTFKLSERKKIKPNELYYVDHPIFGVLVQIKHLQETSIQK